MGDVWRDRQKRRVFRGMSRAVWSPSGGGFGATFERDDMTRQEEQEWADGLGPTDATRRGVIYDLLRHATGDKMSDADRAICERQLDRLMSHGVVSQKETPRQLSGPTGRFYRVRPVGRQGDTRHALECSRDPLLLQVVLTGEEQPERS